MIATRLKNRKWQSDRMILGDLIFRLEHYRNDDWELGDNCFTLYKTSFLIDEYIRFFFGAPGFCPQTCFGTGHVGLGQSGFLI